MLEKFLAMDLWGVFRLLIVPLMFLGAMIHQPAVQWAVLGLTAVWTGVKIAQTVCRKSERGRMKRGPRGKRQNSMGSRHDRKKLPESEDDISGAELFAIRQINQRVTEQLKRVYPSAAWLWVRRPDLQEMEAGGSWRIQLDNADAYNAGEVKLAANGSMEITLLLTTPLDQAGEKAEVQVNKDPADLKPEEELDRTDAMTWYTQYGAELLSGMIDDFNVQGHKCLTIDDEGTVYLKSVGKDLAVDRLEWFLPRLAWAELSSLLKEDGIKATEADSGLVLNW